MQRTGTFAWVLLIWALVALLAAGCGGGGSSDDGVNAYAPPKADEAAIDVVVVVELTNNPAFDMWALELNGVSLAGQFNDNNEDNLEEPLVVPPGRIRFFLDNRGTLAHNFQVRHTDGTNIKKTRNVAPRKTGELVLDLEAGSYLIACLLSDHDNRGMLRTLIVDPDAQYPAPTFTVE